MAVPKWIADHPKRSAITAVVVFVVVTVPMWLGTVWPLISDKTLAETAAEHNWSFPMTGPLYGWACFGIGILLFTTVVALLRRERAGELALDIFVHDNARQSRVIEPIVSLFSEAGWGVTRTVTSLPKHAKGVWVKAPSPAARGALVWALNRAGIQPQVDDSTHEGRWQVIIGESDDVASDVLMDLRSAKGSIWTLESELRSERGKRARLMLEKIAPGMSVGGGVTVRFIEFADAEQGDYITGLLRQHTGWTVNKEHLNGSSIRRRGPSRIEIASGNPENAKRVAEWLNHGMLATEYVYAMEIIDSGSDDLLVTIFPHSSMPS